MSSVLVGMFDTRTAAEQARAGLAAQGFTPGSITANDTEGAANATADSSATAGASGYGVDEEPGFFGKFLGNIFGSDDSAERRSHAETYREAFRRGGFGLTVSTRTEDESDQAVQILQDAGAVDVDERSAQWRTEGWSGSSATASPAAPVAATGTVGDSLAAGATQKVNVVEESLAVGKRTVARGGVRVFSRVIEVPVEEAIQLREEHSDVQRRVVDRPATEADFAAFKEGSIEVHDTAEEAVVSKSARVVGEVEIGTRVTERDEVVRDTVRKTQVDVEQLPGTPGQDAGKTAP